MDIVLTQKDADFILGYLRADLSRINDNCDRVHESEKQIEDVRKQIEDEGSPIEKFFTELFDEAIDKDIEEYSHLYEEQANRCLRCIELLTVGSQIDG